MVYLYIVLCNILIVSIIVCSDVSVTKSLATNNTPPVPVLPNVTQLPSEGGSISPDILVLALPKKDINIPTLDKEAGRSKIVARKGAGRYDDTTKSYETLMSNSMKTNTSIENSSIVSPTVKDKTIFENSSMTSEERKVNITTLKTEIKTVTNTSSVSTTQPAPLPKKPLILDADLLENSPPEVKSSPETVYSQIQSPNNKVKTYISNANSHPGMVMPIVITILLVPMFAVLGYMALRRGQEAWKNRHYKRMDFLLDGMYND